MNNQTRPDRPTAEQAACTLDRLIEILNNDPRTNSREIRGLQRAAQTLRLSSSLLDDQPQGDPTS